jgi:hypothetical protein
MEIQTVATPSFLSLAQIEELKAGMSSCEESQGWDEWMSPDEMRKFNEDKKEISWAEEECQRDCLNSYLQAKETFHLKTAGAWLSFMDNLLVEEVEETEETAKEDEEEDEEDVEQVAEEVVEEDKKKMRPAKAVSDRDCLLARKGKELNNPFLVRVQK